MLHNLLCIAFSLLQALSACGYGLALLRILGLTPKPAQPTNRSLSILLAFAVGLIIQSLLITLSALAMLLNRTSILTILAVGVLLFAAAIRSLMCGTTRTRLALPRTTTGIFLTTIALLAIALLFLESLVPDYSGDAYLYHISAPLFYVLEGGFVPQPWAFYYHYPLLMEMLYAPALALGLEQSAILLNFWITIAAACAIFTLGSAVADRRTGLLAMLVYLLAPLVMQWFPTAQPETGATLFLILSVHALLLWRQSGRLSYAILAGLLGGGLVGCKIIYALFLIGFIVVLCGAAIHDLLTSRQHSPARRAAIPIATAIPIAAYALAAAAAYSLWLIKNARFTGDPFFPVAVDLFPTEPNLKAGALVFAGMHGFPHWAGVSAWTTSALQGLFRLVESSSAGFLLGMLAIPAICVRALRRKEQRFYAALLAVIFLVVCHYGGILQTRWFLPAYALFTIAAMQAGQWALQAIPSVALRRCIATVVAVILLGNFALGYYDTRFYGADSTGVGAHSPLAALSESSRNAFLAELPYYRLAQTISSTVPESGRILVLQAPPYPQVRWYRRKFIQNGQDYLETLTERRLTADQIASELRRAGITHIVAAQAFPSRFLREKATRIGGTDAFDIYVLSR